MPKSVRDDLDLTREQIQDLSSAEALAVFFARLGYPAEARLPMTAEALGLSGDLTRAMRQIERLTSVEEGALEIYLFELKSVTVGHTRALARAFRDRAGNYLLVLTDDYQRLDFVLLERVLPEGNGRGIGRKGITLRPRVLTVDRRNPDNVALRVLRRFTFTEFDSDGQPDPYAQYDKLQSAYVVAEWSEPLFNNRALFSDYYLKQRLPDLPEWDDPTRNQAFREVRGLFADARRRFGDEDGVKVRQELIQPLLEALGFGVETGSSGVEPDFRLFAAAISNLQSPVSFVLAYPWGRYLDGKDETRDHERPEENPGAQVVGLLEAGEAPWAVVTNGKVWRLYSARAHSRATNYYEIDLEETLASPDPGEPFRFFYLLFRVAAFIPTERMVGGEMRTLSFLDWLLEESETYARELGERLKERVFEEIFPHFAEGFIQGLGGPQALLALPEAERAVRLDGVFQGTLTFLYRLLFLLYAESRDLLPAREVRGYYEISLQRFKEEIAEKAKTLEDQAPGHLRKAYSATDTALYERLLDLFRVIDKGDPARNVPIYNGGLFLTELPPPQPSPYEGEGAGRGSDAEARTARFLLETRMPDRYLALGLDRLARDVDPKRGDLVFIDYKSLGVRQLGSIYEGLLEFKVRLAEREMAMVRGKKTDEVLPAAEARRKKLSVRHTLPRGAVYLENDRRERKATGSYYTPDYIVKYIVRHTVGPVLDEKFEALRPRLRAAEKRFRDAVRRKQAVEKVTPDRPALLTDIASDVLRDMFDIKVLDPAMGSGHFLVEAVDYTTDRMVRFLDGFPFLSYFFEGMRHAILTEMERQAVTVDPNRLTDVTLLKRHVLKRCIYGVDLNPMAVELAKVSMWLDCFTLGAPLSFLDHHLRCGNSLIGAVARDVSVTFESELPLFGGPFAGLLRAAEIMRGISLLTDVTLSEVHQSAELFREFDRAAKPYKQLLDVYVARDFGVERADEFLRLYGVDAIKAGPDSVGEPYATALHEAHSLYEEKRFFHWDLEFPEVFIDLDRADWKQEGGFDAVVGNPPYDELSESAVGREIDEREFLTRSEIYLPATQSGGRLNWYQFFMIMGVDLLHSRGRNGLIVPMSWMGDSFTSGVRHWLLNDHTPLQIDCFPQKDDPRRRVFPEAKLPTSVFITRKNRKRGDILVRIHPRREILDTSFYRAEVSVLEELNPEMLLIPIVSPTGWQVLEKVVTSPRLGSLSEFGADPTSGEIIFNAATRPYMTEDPSYDLILRGGHIQRYELQETARQGTPVYLKTEKYLKDSRKDSKAFDHQKPRVVYQEGSAIDAWRRVVPTYLPAGYICGHKVCYFVNYKVNPLALLAVFASELLNWLVEALSTTNSLPAYLVGGLPFPIFHLTTPEGERQQHLNELITQYQQDQDAALLASVEAFLPRDEEGSFLAFAPGASSAEEKSDIIHDMLAYLARQMIALNEQKQAEQKHFFDWLEAALHVQPDKQGRAGLDALTGKTTIFGYLGDYQKDEPEIPWSEVEDVLFKNKRHIGANLNDTRFIARLRAEYEKSLDSLRPIKAQLGRTDWLIDQVVYRLYGLTEEEIAVVEGE
jgi:hypothetical protein